MQKVASCAVCKSRTVFKCSRCKRIFYCGRVHQSEHWKHHKYDCQSIIFYKNTDCLGPKDCFIDSSKATREELAIFVSTSLSRVGLCVLDNYLNDDEAKYVFLESRAICVRNTFNNSGEILAIEFLTKNVKLYPAIYNLRTSFNNLVSSASQNISKNELTDKGLYVQHISQTPACITPKENSFSEDSIEKNLLNKSMISCSYFTTHDYCKLDGGLLRYYIQNNKILDVEPTFNRLILFWNDGRITKKSSPSNKDLLIIFSLYNSSS
ncbi:uncharacterized protein LOC136072236 [Hydra vulgaris]|uniref:uncharacterized protein LOC136072236 n=1 Tax=Hydra vulgaris TaxID=6087 RepID=UPI0032E9E1AA